MENERIASIPLWTRPAIFIFFFLTLFILPCPARASVGSIEAVGGTAYFRPGGSGKWAVASKGQALGIGDGVKTGSDGRLSLSLVDGTRLNVGNESELEITGFLLEKERRSAVYTLSTGKLRAVVGRFMGSSDIKVKTLTGVAGVKGTDFIVMNRNEANVLFGKEDDVSVSGTDTSSVILAPGKMTENTRGNEPIEPVNVEPGSALEQIRSELEAITDVNAPVEWDKAGSLPVILARWNINYGHYLADSKRYRDALNVLQIAIDLSDAKPVRAEAHLERGTVLSRNLSEPGKALDEYMAVVDRYPEPPFLENALFSAGLIRMDLGEKDGALKLFIRYRQEFPEGMHRETVEMLMNVLETD
ncbi:MAG: FecR domain-containing protein [Deltaproteobacteria bacterium]